MSLILFLLFGFLDLANLTEILEQEILSKMRRTDPKVWECMDCGYKGKKSHVVEHVEAKHVDHPGYTCQLCPKVFQTRGSLRQHRKAHKYPTIV